ncbi:MAG: hypothetical protein ACXWP4_08630, partial [Polyangiales bacterium]
GAHAWSVGGGSSGFEGAVALNLAVGPRLPVGPDHGPFARLGFRAQVEGNQEFYDSIVELPRTEIGWQYLHDWTALEIGATFGALLTGKFAVTTAEPRILGNGIASGGYAVVQLPMVRLGGTLQRLPAKDGAAVIAASLYGCALGEPFALCIDGRWMQTDLLVGPALKNTTSLYAGAMFGLVPSSHKNTRNTFAMGPRSSL